VQDNCWVCGSEVLSEDNFCRNCGVKLVSSDLVGTQRRRGAVNRRTVIGIFLTVLGIVVGLSSLMGIIPMLAFGMGSVLIGILILYLNESDLIGGSLVASLVLPSLLNVEKLLEDLDLDQRGIYIPVSGLSVSPRVLVPLALTPATKTPPVGLTNSRRVFVMVGRNPEDRGILLDAPGSQILSALERSLRIDFAKLQLDDLAQNLNAGFEALGLGRVTSFLTEEETADVELILTGLVELEMRLRNQAPKVVAQIGTPIASAVVAAFSKSTGRYVSLKTTVLDQGSNKLGISMRLGTPPA